MIHLVTLNPALDLELQLLEPKGGKSGKSWSRTLKLEAKLLISRDFLENSGYRPRLGWEPAGEIIRPISFTVLC